MTKPLTALRPFTGWHMFAILAAFFGVVIAVNMTMATLASKTFGGEVVENSYVASQNFNRWLDEAAKEKALGWKVDAARDAAGHVELVLTGLPTGKTELSAHAQHPLGVLPERDLAFREARPGHFVSTSTVPAGRWRLRIEVKHEGKSFSTEQELP